MPARSKPENEKLARYHAKRDFGRTPEPRGATAGKAAEAAGGFSFVVQKHAARQLHYDFRLELDGVLKSWALAKGPSLDPADKRLAVHVEDHPLEYGGFEGVIPKGEYGGGTVMLWDRGRWHPVEDPDKGYAKGRLKFILEGSRLGGLWTLVRMGGRARGERGDNWLLIKDGDEAARPGEGDALLDEALDSVASGRTMEKIAADRDWVWNSDRTRDGAGKPGPAVDPQAIAGARPGKLPAFLEPQLAEPVARPPAGAGWIHEIKFDGYRALLRIEDGKAAFLTRRGLDWTRRFAGPAAAAQRLAAASALVDGEIVVYGEDGITSFTALQQALSGEKPAPLVFVAFDLLHLDGYDLTRVRQDARKEALEALIAGSAAGEAIRYSDHVAGGGATFFTHACRLGLEGAIAKRADAPWRSGRSDRWVKIKCVDRQEFVIGGFTPPTSGAAKGLGALIVGHFEGPRLVHDGRVGTGFTQRAAEDLRLRLEALKTAAMPFAEVLPEGRRNARWVEPELVAEVEFIGWTADQQLRHASFKGLRDDKEARTVTAEGGSRPRPGRAAGDKPADKPDMVAGVRLTHPEKVMYEGQGLTKRGLADYYETVAPVLLPHIAGRPLSIVRCPSGRIQQCFYQKHHGNGVEGKGIRPIALAEEKGKADYISIVGVEGLILLVQLGVLELHPWGSRTDDPEHPDRLTFDLDPDVGLPWEEVVSAAEEVRERLAALGLASFVKTTGGKGLHVVVPIARRHGWDVARAFTEGLATAMAKDSPGRYVTTVAKKARAGRIFVDFLRNDRGATAVGAYSTRAREGAPVSTPIAWEELPALGRADRFTVETVPRRLAGGGDPWAEMGKVRQSLTAKALKGAGIE